MTSHHRWRTPAMALLVVALLGALVVRAVANVPAELRTSVDAVSMTRDADNALRGGVAIRTDRPTTVTLELVSDDHAITVAETAEPVRTHHIPLLQLRPETAYTVTLAVQDGDGASLGRGRLGTFETAPLPDDMPPMEVVTSDPARMSAGLTMFNSLYRPPAVGGGDGHDDRGWLTVVDAEGEVVWYHRGAGGVQDARRLPDGDLLHGLDEVGARRVTPRGQPVHEWRGTAISATPDEIGEGLDPGEVTELPIHSMHHEVAQLPDGRMVTLSRESRQVTFDEPLCPDSEPGEAELVVGDVVVVIDTETDEVLAEHSLFDVLSPLDDPHREDVDWCAVGYLDDQYPEDVTPRDWTHANAVIPIDDGRTWLVSVRHTDSLVALRAADEPEGPAGSVRWELGVDSDDFEMVGDGRWFWHQHAPELQDDGTILLYDNGNMRDDADEPYSRAVRYAIDPDAGTVEQVWEHRMEPDIYAGFVGDADRLDGTVLITHGGRVSPCRSEDATGDETVIHGDVVEVDEVSGDVVFQLAMRDDETCQGFGVYRAEKIPTIYPAEYDVTVEEGGDGA